MYKLIEFLRRIYVAVLFVVFEAIAIGYYAHSSNYTQAKLLTRSNQVVGGVNGIFADIRSYFTLGRENERLLERVAVLEEELAFYRRSAADSVRTDLLHDMGEKPYELTVARVISNSINKNRNFIVLDRGERDGVEKGMGVLSPEGAMVGYVAASSDRHAVAVSILNTSFNACGKIPRAGGVAGRAVLGDARQRHEHRHKQDAQHGQFIGKVHLFILLHSARDAYKSYISLSMIRTV